METKNHRNNRHFNRSNKKFHNKNRENFKPRETRSPRSENSNFAFAIKHNPETLCSFVVKENIKSFEEISQSLTEIVKSSNIIVVSIPETLKEALQSAILQAFPKSDISCKTYTNQNENILHNNAFNEHESNIFIATNSNALPRPHSIEVLKTYLRKENAIITVPLVYNTNSQIQPYCLRLPNLISSLKISLGCKKSKETLQMLERGTTGYYKVHRIHNTHSQILCINSKAFAKLHLFPLEESEVSQIKFFEKLKTLGNTFFVPMARCIELQPKNIQKKPLKKLLYLLTHVF